jgi:hypothetical protein
MFLFQYKFFFCKKNKVIYFVLCALYCTEYHSALMVLK